MERNAFVQAGIELGMAPLGAPLPLKRDTLSQRRLIEERLPFSVRIVRTQKDLDKAVSIRHEAYGRHIPALAALLEKAEASDSEPGTVVLLAESKQDGSPLGTMRIQTNRYRGLAL